MDQADPITDYCCSSLLPLEERSKKNSQETNESMNQEQVCRRKKSEAQASNKNSMHRKLMMKHKLQERRSGNRTGTSPL